ncbi:hypothetical protein fugu_001902 [Takifugu bimaculatus]|uniref:Uncharacterized protein n=1 Tax=Takifugu bimaculatus TaxID=433685 RepID=A0A4Z2BQ71_9TELE|nr:hypothetical protein fugu_001902 [Takifugu bimaculatus]
MATSSGPSAEKVEASSSQPTLAMMYDYAATSPKSFPHTCSLCKTECIRMKDWIAHQNTVLHLTNCKLLRTRYPNWDGEITLGERVAKDDSKPSTSQDRHQREKHESLVLILPAINIATVVMKVDVTIKQPGEEIAQEKR